MCYDMEAGIFCSPTFFCMSYYNANKTNSSSLMCFSNVPNEKSMIKQLRPNVAL